MAATSLLTVPGDVPAGTSPGRIDVARRRRHLGGGGRDVPPGARHRPTRLTISSLPIGAAVLATASPLDEVRDTLRRPPGAAVGRRAGARRARRRAGVAARRPGAAAGPAGHRPGRRDRLAVAARTGAGAGLVGRDRRAGAHDERDARPAGGRQQRQPSPRVRRVARAAHAGGGDARRARGRPAGRRTTTGRPRPTRCSASSTGCRASSTTCSCWPAATSAARRPRPADRSTSSIWSTRRRPGVAGCRSPRTSSAPAPPTSVAGDAGVARAGPRPPRGQRRPQRRDRGRGVGRVGGRDGGDPRRRRRSRHPARARATWWCSGSCASTTGAAATGAAPASGCRWPPTSPVPTAGAWRSPSRRSAAPG